MALFEQALRSSIRQGDLIPVPFRGVYGTPSAARVFDAATRPGQKSISLGHTDYLIGTYHDLKNTRDGWRNFYPGLWMGTDIHHIVENQHLQFTPRTGRIGSRTYEHEEPCVLMMAGRHRLLVGGLIGDAVAMHRDVSFDVVGEYGKFRGDDRAAPGSDANRDQKAQHRSSWVAGLPSDVQHKIRAALIEIYDFAYHLVPERSLHDVAIGTIKAASD